jgi:tetratricopeptide (TPR) repeat protein
VSDLELLADLHQKQGRYHEAIRAWDRAVELKPGANEAARVYRKLAQCYLTMGEDDKARAALDRLRALQKESADGRDKTGAANKRAAGLPVKLIVSAPKKLLDQVGEGKIKVEDFCRQASVKTLTFGER